MPTRDGYTEGTPSWVDLATTDVNAARDFYSALFGWEFEKSSAEGIPYWMATQKGHMAAGVGPAQEGQPISAWTTYFAVEDADTTADRITAAGGHMIMGPADIVDSGRLAVASDPTGAVFGIWEAKAHKGAGIVNEHGALNWNELQTSDVDTALDFYKEVFGHSVGETEGATTTYYVLNVGDRPVAGAMASPMPEIPNHWGVYFAVDDLEAAFARAKELGATHTYGPMEAPDVGTLLGIADPTGAHMTLIQLAQPVD